MKNIVCCSFGKDSMAMLYKMKEQNMSIDEIIYAEIMFDKDTPAEIPEHESWIKSYAIPKIKKDFGIDVKIVRSDFTYKELFSKSVTKGKRQGQNRGFPLLFGSWCHRDLKIAPIRQYLKKYKDYVQFIGIAFDETKRIDWELKQGNRMPLVDLGITEEEAFNICRENNILSPAYKNYHRLGCWFCHKQGNVALKKVIKSYPSLWQKILDLDDYSAIKFKQNKTAFEITQKLLKEDK